MVTLRSKLLCEVYSINLIVGLKFCLYLEDFQYQEMSAKVDLNSEGGLFLATKLHGRSPKAELNKQVNLNFNIEFNLWKFLESARLLTRIDQDVSKQILSKQKKWVELCKLMHGQPIITIGLADE